MPFTVTVYQGNTEVATHNADEAGIIFFNRAHPETFPVGFYGTTQVGLVEMAAALMLMVHRIGALPLATEVFQKAVEKELEK